MRLIAIPDAGLKFNMPSELSECDAREYMEMCDLIFRYQFLEMDFETLKIQAVYKLLNLSHSKKEPLLFDPDDDEKLSNIILISEFIEDFFDENEDGQLIIKQNYIHNPIKSFKPLMTEYYGPSDAFMNVKWGEYSDALRAFYDFHATGDTEQLFLIAAILYRPEKLNHKQVKKQPDYDGDIREKYNTNILEERVKEFKKIMPLGFIYGVFLYFASFKKYISTAAIPWAGKEIDFSIIFDSGESEEPEQVPGLGIDSITFIVSESGVFGNYNAVRETSTWEMFVRMYDLRKRDLDNKKTQNDNSSQT